MTEDNTTAHAEEILRALRVALVGVLEAVPSAPVRVRLSLDGAELDISWRDLTRPALPTVRADEPAEPVTSQLGAPADAVHAVRSPLVGTFYRASEAGSAPFVEVGDVVTCGQRLAIIEAMKLMNAIEADCDGRVVEFPVADGSPVEFDQPLVLIEPT
ncbi:MAG: acetyl-CoA carboxylase biotin carboxyl carrier protein subunit [Pseudonocardiales bacterium]|nr:MAG: acetyl-CoA carboxylase biotin carboxyl carrier protein subunit [Pseudonocardiales bacterium]